MPGLLHAGLSDAVHRLAQVLMRERVYPVTRVTRRDGLRVLKHARKYLAKKYCTAYGVGWGDWSRWEAKAAYALLREQIGKVAKA